MFLSSILNSVKILLYKMWGSVTTEFDIVSSMSNPPSIIDVEANLTYLLYLWKIVKFTHIHMRDKALQESHLVLFGISSMKKIFLNGFTFLWHIICRIHMLALLARTSVRRDEPEKNDDQQNLNRWRLWIGISSWNFQPKRKSFAPSFVLFFSKLVNWVLYFQSMD